MSLLQAIQQEPWAISAGWLPLIEAIAQRGHTDPSTLEPLLRQMAEHNHLDLDPEAVLARAAQPMENTHRMIVRDGVALLSIRGPLFRYANIMTALSGATSYQAVASDFETALSDPNISAIVPWIDSPGGQVNGVNETAEMMHRARGRKPIRAYVGGTAASGGYWLASAADDITIDETAGLGSIGVRLSLTDTKGADEKRGVQRFELVSDLSPDKKFDPADASDRSRAMILVNQMASVFVDKVARNRSVSRETVLAKYGRGDVLIGRAAIDAGLADRLGSLEDLIAELIRNGDPTARFQPPGASGQSTGAHSMSENSAPAATQQPDTQVTQEALADAVAQARQEAEAGGRELERTRIAAILTHEHAEGRAAQAQVLALETDLDAEAASKVLAASPKHGASKVSKLDLAMGNIQQPNVGDGGEAEDEDAARKQTVQSIGAGITAAMKR